MADINVGKADVKPDRTAHTKGVRSGNTGSRKRQRGERQDDRSTARRSTGINAKHHEPVDPDMPNLPPA
ncbi:hypothetical protein [Streptomyces sp. NPDC047108]|uniref:hypothetical protein n=1 Tax=Streptomyces sp. NPDC047108 TaxID=3155025 RepID=UPI0033F5535E